MLNCPNCKRYLTINQILESSSVSWPNNNWIYVRCPLCNKHSHAEINTGVVSIGLLEGAPGPCLIIHSKRYIDNFSVNKTLKYIECTYEEKKYVFKAKE